MSGAQAMTLPGVVPEWTLGDRLRKAREHADLTQTELAEQIGIARNSVGRYETGDYQPTRPVLIAWALRTGVSSEWLITGIATNGSQREHVDSHHDTVRTASEAQLRGGEAQLRGRHPTGKREITDWSKKIDPDWNIQLHRVIPTDPQSRSLEVAA